MSAEVQGKGIASPSSLRLDDVEGDSSQEVFQHASDPQTVAFEVGQAELISQLVDLRDDLFFAQRAVFASGVGPSK